MSNRYKGGVISATPPTLVAGAGASGTWTLEQQMQATAAGLWPVNGPFYIEDVFSTWLYNGNSSTQTITNGIDLSGKGGLTWIKVRDFTYNNYLYDTARGVSNALYSNATDAQASSSNFASFDSTGFTLNSSGGLNNSSYKYASWTFRKQPKFFDVVTYTGNGTSGRTVAHNLGSVPGCIIVKRTSGDPIDWLVYHRGTDATSPQNYDLKLNTTAARVLQSGSWNDTAPTSTVFTLGDSGTGNTNGETYVAYIFAHNAGGFGLTGTDNVISCGSFTTDGSRQFSVNLGYEPQWVLQKPINQVFPWQIVDTMRGFVVSEFDQVLAPNTSGAEGSSNNLIQPTATGFKSTGTGDSLYADETYIYIAIRRGPMRVPTSGTSVFAVSQALEPSSSALFTAGFSDMSLHSPRVPQTGNGHLVTDRLRGNGVTLETPYANAETTYNYFKYDSNAGAYIPASGYFNNAGGGANPYVLSAFRRAPQFFDEVCYTGTGSNTTQTHNLTVAPELVIIKSRSGAIVWVVGSTAIGFSNYLLLNATDASASGSNVFNNTAPTSTVFSIGTGSGTNLAGTTYVAYLFATCAGVSKVGSYTGTGATQTINCGFTGGARWVMIKRTDSTGAWYYWNSASGIVAGNDPYLTLNTTDAQVTNTDYVDTAATGFEISSTAPAAINANGGTYIFLAIA
jgi:hypothetical protein